MTTTSHAVIVGAGMAGLTAARRLRGAGWSVTVLDKGRGVGGRLATRWEVLPDGRTARFDHGAQFFTARDPQFSESVAEWRAAGLAVPWCEGFPNADGPRPSDGRIRFRGVGGINSVARHAAKGLEVQLQTRVARLAVEGRKWSVRTDSGGVHVAEAVVLTAPVPQSQNLLAAGGCSLPADTVEAMAAVEYAPCLTVMAVLAEPSRLPEPGAVALEGEPLDWLADNTRKGVSPEVPTATIHAGPVFSRQHYDATESEVVAALLAAAEPWLGVPVVSARLHRWRYSRPTRLHPQRCLGVLGPPALVFAGDAFGGPRVEGAFLSGLAAAEWLLSRA